MASRSAERREPVTRGTGNVFADLGFPDAAERQAKLRLAYALNQVLDGRQLSQADAAKVLGVTQPKVSALRPYKLAGLSVERRINLLTALDRDVEIVIRPRPPLAESCQNQRRRSIRLAHGTETKSRFSTAQIVHERQTPSSLDSARGLTFSGHLQPLGTRFLTEAEDRGGVTAESRSANRRYSSFHAPFDHICGHGSPRAAA